MVMGVKSVLMRCSTRCTSEHTPLLTCDWPQQRRDNSLHSGTVYHKSDSQDAAVHYKARDCLSKCMISLLTDCVCCDLQGVMASNLQLLRETHLMDRDYFKYILNLVKASSEICYHKIRRTGQSFSHCGEFIPFMPFIVL